MPFQHKLSILGFSTKFAQKGSFWSKTEEVSITIEINIFELACLHIQICPKNVFSAQNRKSEHHHLILYIGISTKSVFRLGTKFQLKLTILIFSPDLSKKVFSSLK